MTQQVNQVVSADGQVVSADGTPVRWTARVGGH